MAAARSDLMAIRPFNLQILYIYSGHIEFIRFKEYYGMPRGHSLSVYMRFLRKKRTLMYISLEKGDHYYIQTWHNHFLQSFYNLFLGKLKETLPQKARTNTDVNVSDCAHAPWVSHNTPQIQLIQYGHHISNKVKLCGFCTVIKAAMLENMMLV